MKKSIGGILKSKDGGIIPASKAVRAGDYIFVSGQLAFGKDGAIEGATTPEQAKIVMENIKTILIESGATMADIVKCTCWIRHKEDFSAFNTVYAEYFENEPPARSCIPSDLLFGALVEVEAIAYKPV